VPRGHKKDKEDRSGQSKVELCEDRGEEIAVAENWIESSGVGSWQTMEDLGEFS
jgi:hypothetical protein